MRISFDVSCKCFNFFNTHHVPSQKCARCARCQWEDLCQQLPLQAPGKENPECKRRLNFEVSALDVVKYDEDFNEEKEEEEAPKIEEILFSDFFDLSPEIRKTRSGMFQFFLQAEVLRCKVVGEEAK